jgi:toxin ParE1/3/4
VTYRLKLGVEAEADIDDILEWSFSHFGESVSDGYRALVLATLAHIARDPELPGSHERNDLGQGMRTVHLRTCRNEVSPAERRIASPRHFMIYRKIGGVVQVVRLLHEAMDISAQHIPK